MNELPDPFLLILIIFGASLVPFLVIMTTSFVKVAIVLFLIRQALGVQQIPPNLVLYGVTLVISVFIMAPIMSQAYAQIVAQELDLSTVEGLQQAASVIRDPITGFLSRFAEPAEQRFFIDAAQQLWPEEAQVDLAQGDLIVLVPAFVVSELTRAFEIGFLLYLPFIVIDLIVSNILLAMGMIMVSPILIALPFKLFLFVIVDGWTRLTHGLVLSYAGV